MLKDILHNSKFGVWHDYTSLKHDSVRHTLKAILNQELVEITISVHVEVPGIDFCNHIFNLELFRDESLSLSELEDSFLEMVVSREDSHDNIKFSVLRFLSVFDELCQVIDKRLSLVRGR